MKLFVTTALLITGLAANTQPLFIPPATPIKPVTDTLHSRLLRDDYRWLEDKVDTAVVNYTKAQHDYGIQYLQATQKIHAGRSTEIGTRGMIVAAKTITLIAINLFRIPLFCKSIKKNL